MRGFIQRVLLAGAVASAFAAPARAEDAAGVQSKVDAAMKSVKSFVVTTLYPAQAYSSTFVYVAPDRTRTAVAIAANTTDVVTVDGTSYSSKNGAPYEKAPLTPEQIARVRAAGSVKVTVLHPDVVVDGVTYGTFDTTVPLGAEVTLTCNYDKKSFRLARCSNADVTQTYKSYDDPKNTIDAPTNFVDAPKDVK
jgi:hypothetical protein